MAAGFYHTLCLTGPALSGREGTRGAKSLSSDLYRLLNNPAGSDVTFKVEGEAIFGHRYSGRVGGFGIGACFSFMGVLW